MNVSLIQTSLAWEQPEENRKMLAGKMARLVEATDLIVLPEMFTTGFSMNAVALAEPTDGPTLAWMQEHAASTGAVLTGSFICREGDHFTNRLLWVQPDGHFEFYDKKHLFSLAGENKTYSAGQKHLSVHWKGFRIRPLICYDLRFPVWSRQPLTDTEKYDLLIYVANWPKPRVHHWKSLLVARAIENQCFTIGVNIVGQDGSGHTYTGDSALIDYGGNVLLTDFSVEKTMSANLDLVELKNYRMQFPFLNDADFFNWPS